MVLNLNAWGFVSSSVIDISNLPGTLSISSTVRRSHPTIVWTPLAQGSIKINVDNSYSFDRTRSEIGGVIKDHDENALLHFAK